MAKKFIEEGHRVSATSRSPYHDVCREMGVRWCPTLKQLLTPDDHHGSCDVIVVATSILAFEKSIASLAKQLKEVNEDGIRTSYGGTPISPRISPRNVKMPLVVDVCSVKNHPMDVMLNLLPPACDVLCTHPMFGPESGKNSWAYLPMMYDCVRIRDQNRLHTFLGIFEQAGCKMEQMSCQEHDRHAASSQFITHLTGRILAAQGPQPTPVDTLGFKSLLKLVDNTCKDSFDLFFGLYQLKKN